jgi:alpha-L-fucosidase 2
MKMITMLLSPVKGGAGSYPNLFDAHPPFQIDGNFGGAAGIGEMFIQSHTKYIDITCFAFDVSERRNKGICARGGLVLNIKWKDGNLEPLNMHLNRQDISITL